MGILIDKSTAKYTQQEVTYDNLGKMLRKYIDGDSFKTEEERSDYEKKLTQKIQSGKKLTGAELSYIRKNMPEMYASVVRAQKKRKVIEEECRNAESKEEINKIYNNAINQIDEKDPDRELLISAIKSAVNEFKESSEYKKLPEKEKKEEKEKEKYKTDYYNKMGGYQEIQEPESMSSFSLKG